MTFCSLKTRSITANKLIEMDSDWIASLPNSNSFKHSSTSQLLANVIAVKRCGWEFAVGLDASYISWLWFLESDNQLLKLCAELIGQWVTLEWLSLCLLRCLEDGLVDGFNNRLLGTCHSFSNQPSHSVLILLYKSFDFIGNLSCIVTDYELLKAKLRRFLEWSSGSKHHVHVIEEFFVWSTGL